MTQRGRQAAALLGSYFHDYLIHQGLLTGDAQKDLKRSYFRANSIERSNVTAAQFGSGLLPGAKIPVHSYSVQTPDPIFDPISAGVATVDTARAAAEAQSIFAVGMVIPSAYSSEYSLVRSVLFDYPAGAQPTPTPPPNKIDFYDVPVPLTANPPPLVTGNVINVGGMELAGVAIDPFVMQYADNFPLE